MERAAADHDFLARREPFDSVPRLHLDADGALAVEQHASRPRLREHLEIAPASSPACRYALAVETRRPFQIVPCR